MADKTTTTESSTRSEVGADIRALRKSRDVTLVDMAKTLDRSVGWLSQIERGQTEPGILDLRKISQMFEIPTSFFFRNELADENDRGYVVRAKSRASLGSRREGLVEELLSPDLSGDFEMFRSEFEPHAESGWIEARPTNEGGYLISGNLTISIGKRQFDLATGDSFQFQNETYRWENSGDEPAIILWIVSPPIY